MEIVGDVKCYHCGHVSGQVEGTRTDRLVIRTFTPREGYTGTPPKRGQRIHCERCEGPVYLEDLRPAPDQFASMAAAQKQKRPSRTKAA